MTTDAAIQHYLTEFARIEKQLSGTNLEWLQALRSTALKQFSAQGFPTSRDEDWKYTNVTPIIKQNFLTNTPSPLEGEGVRRADEGYLNSYRLNFINGIFSEEQSNTSDLPSDVIITNLATAFTKHSDIIQKHLNKIIQPTHGFTALNTSFINDGAFIFLPKGTILEKPIELCFVTTDQTTPNFIPLRNLIITEENTQAIIIENYTGTNQNPSFTNAVTELFINQRAHLEHYKLLQETESTFHISTLAAKQQSKSCFTSNSFAAGGALVRSDSQVLLADEYAECTLNGLYLAKKRQHIDHHTIINHAKPHCTSQEFYKGIIADHGRAVFNGKVVVAEGAFKTNAQQSNKNLLLSANAEIDTKPELEIYADDVQCAHGATVGQIDETALFYLQSRGIDKATARTILIYAFAREIIERIPLEPLKKQLQNKLNQFF